MWFSDPAVMLLSEKNTCWSTIEDGCMISKGKVLEEFIMIHYKAYALLFPKVPAGWLIIFLDFCIYFKKQEIFVISPSTSDLLARIVVFNVVLYFQFRLLFSASNLLSWDGHHRNSVYVSLCLCTVFHFQNSQRNLYTCESRTPAWFSSSGLLLDFPFSE